MSKTKIILKINPVPERFLVDRLAFTGITRLDLVHKGGAKFFKETHKFIKNYIPALRYHNPDFDFRHRMDPEIAVPRILVFDKEQKHRDTLETGGLKLAEIVASLKALDQKYAANAGQQ